MIGPDFEKKYPTPKQLLAHFHESADVYNVRVESFPVFANYHLTYHGRTVCVRYVQRKFHVCFRGVHIMELNLEDYVRFDLPRYNNSWSVFSVRETLEAAVRDFTILSRNLLRLPPRSTHPLQDIESYL